LVLAFFMKQIFRITFEQKDYLIHLVNTLPVDHHTLHFEIILDDICYRLVKNNGNWSFENVEDPHLIRLAAAIGKVISLRYRI
jgi:hypothetical protein